MTATPEIVSRFLRDYRFLTESDFKCPKCGEWFSGIDNLAPYHWETCWCEKCQAYPLMPSDDATRSNSVLGDAKPDSANTNALDKTT